MKLIFIIYIKIALVYTLTFKRLDMLTQKDMFRVNNLHDTFLYGLDYVEKYDYIDNQDEVINV